ncbi:MAG: glycosyltransferase family 2 protein [Amylibacter sp.]|nr:glycosyltransferase family 2 protein [Amylibacter sp.]
MKISIIIPTRERAEYLRYSIQTALEINDDNLEIVICNNASQDNTEEVVKSFSDPRIRYVNTGTRISMRENFNRALHESSGEYVIFFGDDDGIVPGQFKYLRQLLEAHRPDGISWNRATYGWPIKGYGKKTGGIRFYKNSTYGTPYLYNPNTKNIDALMGCRLGQLFPVTPNIYHGCVSRAYLDKMAPSKDIYFDSTIPDVNFEFRTILAGGNFMHANHPFSINGYSPASTGGAHNNNAPDAPGAKAGKAFVAENKTDPLQDVMDHALTIPMVFFSTLETVIQRMRYTDRTPNYVRWYQYGLTARLGNPDRAARITEILTEHAARTGTQEQLAAAENMPPKPKRTLKERVSRVMSQAASFKVSAMKGNENTILSAVQVCDDILGCDYEAVLQNARSGKAAWKDARKRSKV